ncbi:MAG: T9SS type A sorting domain-containing protein [Flavobacteriaceae bacterium]|nr:T9SS type A sorting domain-containing protein [Flavobacteriaceae bacterium]
MVKKLLCIFITVFAFSNVNSQNIVIQHFGCQGDQVNEFEHIGSLNGKNQYQRLDTASLTALGTSFGAIGGTTNIFIEFDGTDWIFYQNTPATRIFEQTTHTAGIAPPDLGWLGLLGSCTGQSIEVLSGGVLNMKKESLDNKISIYPNPSSDFINISNIKEVTKIRITNITGQTVMSDLIDQNNNQIDIKGLSKGFYFVEIEGKKTIKLIKK